MQNLYIDTQYMMVHSLEAMIQLLKKVEAQAQERSEDTDALLQARLAPDMFPFVKQVQVMSDNAKGAMARLGGKEIPSYEDTESTLGELVARLEKTLAFVQSVTEDELHSADELKIIIPYIQGKFQTAEDYTRDYAIPNFYFHFVTAYAILRMKGYDIGKLDFVGSLHLQDL